MTTVHHSNIYRIGDYSKHLKALDSDDRYSRFGHPATDYNIDQLILDMCYHPTNHELWFAEVDNSRVAWGHMAKNNDDTWELAVSVSKEYQRRGIAGKLMAEMISWAKFHQVTQVYMNCIESNKVIQHLAQKHDLLTKSRGDGERTAAIEVPQPNFVEASTQLFKEQDEIIKEIARLRNRLANLWLNPGHQFD